MLSYGGNRDNCAGGKMRKAQSVRSGRAREAEANDGVILAAAMEVFIADPRAPIAAVARRAGVGMSAVYRRFASKDALLQQLCWEGLNRYIAEARAAWADNADPWLVFCAFMERLVEANTHALTIRVAGAFKPTEELYALAAIGQDLNSRIFNRVREANALRPGVEVDDLSLILEQLASINLGDPARNLELRRRYLALFLDGVRISAGGALPGPAPSWEEVRSRWEV
jgi:AcrR family transcriptional regulator